MGHTVRALQVRLNEHVANIKQGFPGNYLSRHCAKYHNRSPAGTLFVGIEKYSPHWREGYFRWGISKLEMQWIHDLKSYRPYGLNVDWDINSFSSNRWRLIFHNYIYLKFFLLFPYFFMLFCFFLFFFPFFAFFLLLLFLLYCYMYSFLLSMFLFYCLLYIFIFICSYWRQHEFGSSFKPMILAEVS